MNKGVLAAIVAVAAGSLLGVAFLLGRASGPSAALTGGVVAPGVSSGSPDPSIPTPTPAAASITVPEEARRELGPAPSAPDPRGRPEPAPGPTAGPPAGAVGGAGPDPARAAVAAYLDGVDHIQPGKMGGDAEGVANEMATALVRGDTSGLDKMIRETEAARASLAAMTPPVPCVAHHRESLGSLDDALEMLRSLRSAMESSEPAAQLAAVGTRAAALRSRSEAVQREEQALRQSYGLTR